MEFHICYESDEHPRTINTPRNARTNWSSIECNTEREVIFNYFKLRILQGKRIYFISGRKPGEWSHNYVVCKEEHGEPYLYRIPSRGLPCYR